MGISTYALTVAVKTFKNAEQKLRDMPEQQIEIEPIQKTDPQTSETGNDGAEHSVTVDAKFDTVNICYDNGFYLRDSCVPLSYHNQSFIFDLPGQHSIILDSSKASVAIDQNTVVTIQENNAAIPDDLIVVKNSQDDLFLLGKYSLSDATSILVKSQVKEDEVENQQETVLTIMRTCREIARFSVNCEGIQIDNASKCVISREVEVQQNYQFTISPFTPQVPFDEDNETVHKINSKDDELFKSCEADINLWKTTYDIVDSNDTKEREMAAYYIFTENGNFQVIVSDYKHSNTDIKSEQ